MTDTAIDWRYTIKQDLGVFSVAGLPGPEAVRCFGGAVGWVVARSTGPVVLDLTKPRNWSAMQLKSSVVKKA